MHVAAIVGVRDRRHPRVGSDIQWNSPPRGCRRSRTRSEQAQLHRSGDLQERL